MTMNKPTRTTTRRWLRVPIGAPLLAAATTMLSGAGAHIALIANLALRVWPARHRQRRQLMELAPERLRDIGISREAAFREAAKPFWR